VRSPVLVQVYRTTWVMYPFLFLVWLAGVQISGTRSWSCCYHLERNNTL